MATSIVETLMTAENLIQMPDDGHRYELIRGELIQMSPAGRTHGRIAARIIARLDAFVESHNLGEVHASETGFILSTDPDTVRAPDASFVSRARTEAIGDTEGYFPGPPDLAIEIISPGDTYSEVESKALDWLAAGTHMVIVLDPKKKTATVYRSQNDIAILTEDQTFDGGTVVPGWTVSLRELFA